MKPLFWLSLFLIAYAYVGYLLLLALYARLHRRPIRAGSHLPSVSILIAAHNEEANLPAKLANLAQLDYPQPIQIVIASDGSSDRTNAILQQHASWITPILLDQPGGKAAALNHAVRHATGDILVFLDVRQRVDPNALTELIACFADPSIGAVSGELLLESATESAADPSAASALGIYWKIEKAVRRLESASGSVVGVTGAIYALRRELFVPIPPNTILDDVFVPMNVARLGKRIVFQPSAIARDRIFAAKGKEFARKVRTLSGNYQLLQLAPWLLTPANPLLFRLISHKLLRLLVPFLLLFLLVSSLLIPEPFYRLAFLAQLVFYGLAACGALRPQTRGFKPVAIANTFVMLNLAAAFAFYNFAAGRKHVWA